LNRSLRATLAVLSLALLFILATAQATSVIRVSFLDDVATLDPAIGYDVYNWPIEHALFATLLDYHDTTPSP
jgi:oligopeptide transport system substrate-binding protein